MANWAWPHTPNSRLARLLLVGGPFDGEEVGFLPPDTAAPIQIAWGGWMPWGFAALVYAWNGECTVDRGRTDALIYRPDRWIDADAIPPLMAEMAEMWADSADMIMSAFDVPASVLWPGI